MTSSLCKMEVRTSWIGSPGLSSHIKKVITRLIMFTRNCKLREHAIYSNAMQTQQTG